MLIPNSLIMQRHPNEDLEDFDVAKDPQSDEDMAVDTNGQMVA
jgi:hypothetical protein